VFAQFGNLFMRFHGDFNLFHGGIVMFGSIFTMRKLQKSSKNICHAKRYENGR
jgi:hypothetical protein